ncbi:MAG: alkaline phosphatase family protein [Halobacteriales archaeon]
MTQVVVCLDGLDPTYLEATATPEWDGMAAVGAAGTCQGVVPSLTNVNNVSIVTGRFPEDHGITGNTVYNREADELVYMEGAEFRRADTRFQLVEEPETTAALVAKEKLEGMVGTGCDIVASAESPPAWLSDAVGEPPGIYSGAASEWLLGAAEYVLKHRRPDLLYVSTTDVVPHKHAPGTPAATEWVEAIDTGLGRLRRIDDDIDLVATADHGMSRKTRRIDLAAHLERAGYSATVIPLIRDRHTYHHQNLGGVAYVYLHEASASAGEWLADIDGIDAVYETAAAAERFYLPPDRIGDLMVLGTVGTVFGPIDGEARTDTVDLRSHGSVHERRVPYVTTTGAELTHNLDAFDAVGR